PDFLLCMILLAPIQSVAAPPNPFHAIANQAIADANQRCGGLARNTACYGARSVRASFSELTDQIDFDEPSDTVDVTNILGIESAPLDPNTQQIGVAIMRLNANIPNTLPGQAVVLVLLGDISLQNEVPPESAFVAADAIAIVTTREEPLYAGPTTTFNTVETVAPSSVLLADGFSEDRMMMRVVTETGVAWIDSTAVTTSGNEADTLPIITSSSYGAMQAFTLTPGVGTPSCADAPDALMVQTPQGNPITLRINGAEVTVSSTVVFRPENDRMELAVLDGRATLESGTQVLPGFQTRIALDPLTNTIFPEQSWEEIEIFDEDLQDDFEIFETIQNDIVNYLIDEPDEDYFREIESLLEDSLTTYEDLFELDEDGDGVLDFEEDLEAAIDALNDEFEDLDDVFDDALDDLDDAFGDLDDAFGDLDDTFGDEDFDDTGFEDFSDEGFEDESFDDFSDEDFDDGGFDDGDFGDENFEEDD
ncbi:MAG: hypothetical protein AAF125_15890, partial [Chloroflexota bacterium]